MPNRVRGRIEVRGAPDDVQRFAQVVGLATAEWFAATVPEPEYEREGTCHDSSWDGPASPCSECWYCWRIEHWGVLGLYQVEVDQERSLPHSMHYWYETPWSLPVEWARRASEAFPELLFIVEGTDLGGCVSGLAVARAGEILSGQILGLPGVEDKEHPWYPHYWRVIAANPLEPPTIGGLARGAEA
jgi:Ferredoxin-like domain in Api92-like protein